MEHEHKQMADVGHGKFHPIVLPKFSIEEIKHYLEGLCLVGDHRENDMLNCAISLLEDREDGIEAVLERRRMK